MSDFVSTLSSGNNTECIKTLDATIKAVKLNKLSSSTLSDLLTNRGILYAASEKFEDALRDFEEALKLTPLDIRVLYHKGQALSALKKQDEAKQIWKEALSLSKNTTDAQLALNLITSLKACNSQLPTFKRPSNLLGISIWIVSVLLPLLCITSSYVLISDGFLVEALQKMPTISVLVAPPGSGFEHKFTPISASVIQRENLDDDLRLVQRDIPPTPVDPDIIPITSEANTTVIKANSTVASENSPKISLKPKKGKAEIQQRQKETKEMESKVSIPELDGLNPSVVVSQAVNLINSGHAAEAEKILSYVMDRNPPDLGAFVARGTARAMSRRLEGAIEDFSAAIAIEPRYGDAYKRRAQARSALNDVAGALEDFQMALDLAPLWGQSTPHRIADLKVEKALVYQRISDYRNACEILQGVVKTEVTRADGWNLFGLCSTSQGNILDAIRGYRQAVTIDPTFREAWVNMAQIMKETGNITATDEAFANVFKLPPHDHTLVNALKTQAHMKMQLGRHNECVSVMDTAFELAKDDQMLEVLFTRGQCYHAQGYIREAVREYEAAITAAHGKEDNSLQFMAFYQKELALHMASRLDMPAMNCSFDNEILPEFKENWCKKSGPSADLVRIYKPLPPLPIHGIVPSQRSDLKNQKQLTDVADMFGILLQNDHLGFLPHARNQRAAGFAAMELAQLIRDVVKKRRAGEEFYMAGPGSTYAGGKGELHRFMWRDAMDVIVKWRQIGELNDQVIWVDLLTAKEFEQGFGSHTPMFTGQTKTVRYYSRFDRAMNLFKKIVLENKYVYNISNEKTRVTDPYLDEMLDNARTAEEVFQIIGFGCYVVAHIESRAEAGKLLEGTRFTLVQTFESMNEGYEFSIRTPVTPARWKDFDKELDIAWENLMSALVAGAEPPVIADLILTYGFYWYNFMPLARGTAACGYTTMLSLFWMADMPISSRIPKEHQVDWEAILSYNPEEFIRGVSHWLYPKAARKTPGSAPAMDIELPPIASLPSVTLTLPTMRYRIEALNGEKAKRITA